MATGRAAGRFVGDTFRYSLPIVLGRTIAGPKETCMPCHAGAMGLNEGEMIAVFSSSLSAAADCAALNTLLWRIAGAGLIVGLLVIAGIWRLLGGVVTRPLARMTETMRRLAEGDTKVAVPAEDRGDEIGAMAKAILVFRDAAIENVRLESEASGITPRPSALATQPRRRNRRRSATSARSSTPRSASRSQSSPARTFPIA